ncbi:hypothetical protein [Luteitalea sp.]
MTHPVTLLVAHQGETRATLAAQLRERGLQVVEASSVDEACGLAEVGHVDVVVAVRLPTAVEGRDLARRLRCTPGAESLPVVAVGTGETPDAEGDSAPAARLPDPCAVDDLIAVLGRVSERAAVD